MKYYSIWPDQLIFQENLVFFGVFCFFWGGRCPICHLGNQAGYCRYIANLLTTRPPEEPVNLRWGGFVGELGAVGIVRSKNPTVGGVMTHFPYKKKQISLKINKMNIFHPTNEGLVQMISRISFPGDKIRFLSPLICSREVGGANRTQPEMI